MISKIISSPQPLIPHFLKLLSHIYSHFDHLPQLLAIDRISIQLKASQQNYKMSHPRDHLMDVLKEKTHIGQ
jgi:hypothetical protein